MRPLIADVDCVEISCKGKPNIMGTYN